MTNCPFCSLCTGKIPSYQIYADDYSCVFLDQAQDVDFHLLAIPKKHIASLFTCDQATLDHVMQAIQIVGQQAQRNGFTGLNLLNANGKSAGQSIPHLHFHLILRQAGDQIDAWPHFAGAKLTMPEIYQRLKVHNPR